MLYGRELTRVVFKHYILNQNAYRLLLGIIVLTLKYFNPSKNLQIFR